MVSQRVDGLEDRIDHTNRLFAALQLDTRARIARMGADIGAALGANMRATERIEAAVLAVHERLDASQKVQVARDRQLEVRLTTERLEFRAAIEDLRRRTESNEEAAHRAEDAARETGKGLTAVTADVAGAILKDIAHERISQIGEAKRDERAQAHAREQHSWKMREVIIGGIITFLVGGVGAALVTRYIGSAPAPAPAPAMTAPAHAGH